MDPTPQELSQITSLDQAADWANLLAPHRDQFFEYMGVSANDHPRTLAFFTEAEFRMAINSWTLDGVAPPPGLWAQAGIVGRVCRLVCGRPADDPVEQ
eukprot:684182-Amphidinium_carterae.1